MEHKNTEAFLKLCKNWGIAITGGVASGKSTVAGILRQNSYTVIDADFVSRLVVAPGSAGLDEVVARFGKHILNPEGEMDRALMRQIVFQDPQHRALLESIIHKRLNAATADLVQQAGLLEEPKLWFYEASLIYERGRQHDFASVWVAYCPREIQIQRLMKRDASNRQQAEAILAAQMSAYEKKSRANRVIDTDCSLEELAARVRTALAETKVGS